jgi:hypothetical protein
MSERYTGDFAAKADMQDTTTLLRTCLALEMPSGRKYRYTARIKMLQL